jgi:hypothetical protein
MAPARVVRDSDRRQLEVEMKHRQTLAVALVTILTVLIGPTLSAQNPPQMRIAGTLNDLVWVEAGAGAGAWQVSGTWSARLLGNSGKVEFLAAILGVRSDLWVLQEGVDPATALRSPHTHHVGLLDGTVTTIPGGIRLTGTAIITTNGNTAPFSNSPIVVEITGGNTVPYSNMKLMFLGASTEHFGSQPYDGVVTIER